MVAMEQKDMVNITIKVTSEYIDNVRTFIEQYLPVDLLIQIEEVQD
jgi:hypothetical protein